MRWALLLSVALFVKVASFAFAHQGKKPATVTGEVVCLTCYLTHEAKGEKHAQCAANCARKGLPMGILKTDGKLLVALEDHESAGAYQQLKKFAGQKVTVTGTLHTRHGMTGIAVQKVSVGGAKQSSGKVSAAKYVCPMGCIPSQDKPGNCPKCGMKLVVQK